jgi:hypothetical protein
VPPPPRPAPPLLPWLLRALLTARRSASLLLPGPPLLLSPAGCRPRPTRARLLR